MFPPLTYLKENEATLLKDLQNNRILSARYKSSHFDVSDAVVDRNNRFVPELSQCSSCNASNLERGSHSWTFCVCNCVDIIPLEQSLNLKADHRLLFLQFEVLPRQAQHRLFDDILLSRSVEILHLWEHCRFSLDY